MHAILSPNAGLCVRNCITTEHDICSTEKSRVRIRSYSAVAQGIIDERHIAFVTTVPSCPTFSGHISSEAIGKANAPSRPILFLRHSSQIQNVVTADQHLPEIAGKLPINPLLRAGKLKIHVRIDGHQIALIFHPPFQLGDDRLTSEIIQEWLRVHWDHRHDNTVVSDDARGQPLPCVVFFYSKNLKKERNKYVCIYPFQLQISRHKAATNRANRFLCSACRLLITPRLHRRSPQ